MKTIFRSGMSLFAFILILLSQASAFAQELPKDAATYPYWVEMMQDPSANFFETQLAFETYWENREVTRGSGYKPFKRWEYWMEKRVDAAGNKPAPDHKLREYQKYMGTSNSRESAGDWTPLGPYTVPSGYNGYRGLGRINAIEFHPTNPDIIYIGAPSGGFWRTDDGGQTWITHTDILPTLGVSEIIVDYTNPVVIYMGTGDRDASDAPGLGVWKSLDGGITWAPSNNGMGNATVGRMLIHPTDNQTLFAATSTGIYKTTDAGELWYKTKSGNFKEIVYKPGNPEIIYAATGGVFNRSQDGGENFDVISSGLPGGARGVIAVSASSPEIVYFLLTNQDSFKGIYQSTDSGLTFTVRSTSPNIMAWDCNGGSGGQAWYDLDIAVDPEDSDVIFAGGVNTFKSINGGLSWFITSHWYGGCNVTSVHADLHVLEYNPINNRLYAGNDGGLYWTANSGQNWTEISNGLVISQAYKIGQSATKRDYVINGYQDNGTSTYTGTEWIAVGGGDGMECAFDPLDERYSYFTIYYGDISRLYNHNPQGQIAGQGTNGITEGGGWVTPFLIDPFDGNTMFVGYKNVWRSTNIKAPNTNSVSWTKISNIGSGNLEVMAQSRANTEIMYVSSGNVLNRSDNVKEGQVQWIGLSSSLSSGNTITALETSPVDENTVYIAQQNRIFKSTNKGFNWTEISGSLPNTQINSIAYYRNSAGGLYLGTDIGIFYRDDHMDDWILFSSGFPAAGTVTELEIFYDPAGPEGDVIRAGTYGRGLWESPVNYSVLTADFEASELEVTIDCGVDFMDLSVGVPFEWEWTFEGADIETSVLRNPQGITWSTPGQYNVTLKVINPVGDNTIVKNSYINVSEDLLPAVVFMADKRVFCSTDNPLVRFTDDSKHCPTGWNWSFVPGDVTFTNGTSAASPNPEVLFNSSVNYDVTLTVNNVNGSTQVTMEDYIQIGGFKLPFKEDWESQSMLANSWAIENPDNSNTWEFAQVGGSSGGTTAIRMNFFDYAAAPGPRDRLISPPFNFSNEESVFLGFDHAYVKRYAQISDSLIILVSPDCGETWQRVFAIAEDKTGNFETHPVVDDELFVPSLPSDWCGSPGNPECTLIDLSQYAGSENIRIAFESYHRRGNSLYLDNIFLTSSVNTMEIKANNQGIALFPNPAVDVLNIRSGKDLKNAKLEIVSAIGRTIYERNLENGRSWTIATSKLAKGVYVLQISTSDKTYTEKLIIE